MLLKVFVELRDPPKLQHASRGTLLPASTTSSLGHFQAPTNAPGGGQRATDTGPLTIVPDTHQFRKGKRNVVNPKAAQILAHEFVWLPKNPLQHRDAQNSFLPYDKNN